jgi:hypothetical protein
LGAFIRLLVQFLSAIGVLNLDIPFQVSQSLNHHISLCYILLRSFYSFGVSTVYSSSDINNASRTSFGSRPFVG